MLRRLLSKRNSTSSSSSSSNPQPQPQPQVIYVQQPAHASSPSSGKASAAPAPPAYSHGVAQAAVNPHPAPAGLSAVHLGQGEEEDPFDFLRDYDTVLLIDNSGSMAGTRWTQTRDALASIVTTAARYDSDGVDLHWLNKEPPSIGLKRSDQVMALFSRVKPGGGTPTGARLERLLQDHITLLERAKKSGGAMPKPLNIVVLTDGEPSDDPRSVIIAAARRLDRGDFPLSAVGIFFLQIGNDPAATEALAELDDDLGEDLRDIVDTAPYVPGSGPPPKGWIEKVLMGGINRRIDRKVVAAR